MNKITEPTTNKELFQCPNGCDFNEIEIGKESESFMAMMNSPHQYLRCGKCGFNDPEEKSHAHLSYNLGDCIDKWNKAASDENT